MSGLLSSDAGPEFTPRELRLCAELAELIQFANDLLVILTYLTGESNHASTSSTGAGRSTDTPSSNDHLGDNRSNGDACGWSVV